MSLPWGVPQALVLICPCAFTLSQATRGFRSLTLPNSASQKREHLSFWEAVIVKHMARNTSITRFYQPPYQML